ncbi:spindle and kinetochore-associated protein 1 [Lampris incognitus]|uniref:spindle and kinetochore-associated protein 1 n=1 Tax=Lampris incognitus TaxID=2546036 RepID=UPI0024B48F92|nr:spindle and kinetochore-associated protein 1 [Lampris incognitus]
MSEFEDITRHINDKILSLQRMLDLAVAPQNRLQKLGQEIRSIEGLLYEFEKCVDRRKDQLKHLKELERSFQMDFEAVQHLNDNIPIHMPRRKLPEIENKPATSNDGPVEMPPVQQRKVNKTDKNHIKEMEPITMPEFEGIPQYMKGRVTYDQLNAAVHIINAAVTAKYKIVHHHAKGLNNSARVLKQRFKDEETKDTKGHFFVVEDDIHNFTQTKVDKRFQAMLNMLRHCQRLRELRGGGLTRYVLV